MSGPWAGNHLWVFQAANVRQVIHDALRYGFDGLLLKAHDGSEADDEKYEWFGLLDEALNIREELGIDLTIGAWGYLYGPHFGEGQVEAERAAIQNWIISGCDWYVIDAESEWEVEGANEAVRKLMEPLRETHPQFPIGYTSFWNTRWHSAFPFAEFAFYCDVVMPQVYYVLAGRESRSSIRRMYNIAREDFSRLDIPIAPVGQINGATPAQIQTFQEILPDNAPRSWWLWEEDSGSLLVEAGGIQGQNGAVSDGFCDELLEEIRHIRELLDEIRKILRG